MQIDNAFSTLGEWKDAKGALLFSTRLLPHATRLFDWITV
jgi:hypothetical protein